MEKEINSVLCNIEQAGNLLALAFECYFKNGISPEFMALKEKVSLLEAENDSIRREVENQLYAQLLLPDMRSDILKLIEGCDKIINKYETDLILISVETPKIPKQIKSNLSEMIDTNIQCVSALMEGIKQALKGFLIQDFVQKTYTLEHQVDLQAMELKRIVFQDLKLPLARQIQLKEFIYRIEKISDMAEDMADMLSVFVVKHAV